MLPAPKTFSARYSSIDRFVRARQNIDWLNSSFCLPLLLKKTRSGPQYKIGRECNIQKLSRSILKLREACDHTASLISINFNKWSRLFWYLFWKKIPISNFLIFYLDEMTRCWYVVNGTRCFDHNFQYLS